MVTMGVDQEVSDRVKSRREYLQRSSRRNLSQAYVAEQVGLERSTYANKENGKFPFTVEELANVAKVLNVSVSYLYGEHGNDPNHDDSFEAQLDDLPEDLREDVRAMIQTVTDRHRRRQTTHGKKAE